MRRYVTNFETKPQSPIEECVISCIYNTLSPPSSDKYKESWEKDMGIQIPDDMWEDFLEYVHTCSNNTRHCLIQFKIIHRLHYSKAKIHNIFPTVSPTCDKCQSSDATLFHGFVSCPKVTAYWCDVFNTMSNILNITLTPDPLLIILGTSESSRVLTKAQQRFLSYCIITAKKLLLM